MNTDNLHIDDILKKVKRIHFIGIGGAGMCPLAEILIQLGYNVSGSDNNDTETFRRIEKEGAKVYFGQVKENITDDVELVISYSTDTETPTTECEKTLSEAGFPSSYWGGICSLKEKNPSWTFQPVKIELNWDRFKWCNLF